MTLLLKYQFHFKVLVVAFLMENSAQDYEIEDLKCLNCKLHTAHLETTKDLNFGQF